MIDGQIRLEMEQAGRRTSVNWDRFWVERIEALRKSQENPDRYIEYIIRERRKLGLPEIPLESSP
jgi:hypothetical protein